MLPTARVKVKRGRISYIASCVIGNNGDIVADLILVRITFVRIKRGADWHVS